MIEIIRKRYIILRTQDNSIFCGLARQFHFTKLTELKNEPLKTYLSESKAKSSFLQSWWKATREDFENGTYKIIEVEESVQEVKVNEEVIK